MPAIPPFLPVGINPYFYPVIMNTMSITALYDLFLKHPVLSTDSRNIPSGCIFFALKGDNFNGNGFALQAIEKGAAWAVVDEDIPGDKCIRTEDVLKTLQELARHHRQQLQIPFLAITGSNGKTTTKELVHAVLASHQPTYATKGNLNNHIGVPLSVLAVTSQHRFAVIEMGANHLQEIALLCSIALPDYGMITNVGKAHLEGFGGFEGVKKGKGELYEALVARNGTVFLNDDNLHLQGMADKAGVKHKIRYGTGPTADCRGRLLTGLPFVVMEWQDSQDSGNISTFLAGAYNFENILAAVCIGRHFGVPVDRIHKAISSYVPSNSRSQLVVNGTNKMILDAYNANPTSMSAALKNFDAMPEPRKILFVGEMAELGEEGPKEHQAIADLVDQMNVEEVILVGQNFRHVKLRRPCQYFDTSEQAAAYAKEKKFTNAAFLIKGSRSTQMEKVFEAL